MRIDWNNHPLAQGKAPEWACAWGEDQYGGWASFEVDGVVQRLRWIPAGSFLIGSPEGEDGRSENEGPQHEVDLTEGFWIFDTPCTQELWEKVMGENPSRFQAARRPVEKVSWEEVQRFLKTINERLVGFDLSLPTEAQWEFACRAGETRAVFTGDLEILGENNAPALHEIAWYGGNCGVGYDLKDGYDTSDWTEKQFVFEKGGTREVAQKKPNQWGCYDMLGNVWEWCADWYSEYDRLYEVNPTGPEADSLRVVRGGCWTFFAGDCRSACRGRFEPGFRDFFLGFRPVLVQQPSKSGGGAG